MAEERRQQFLVSSMCVYAAFFRSSAACGGTCVSNSQKIGYERRETGTEKLVSFGPHKQVLPHCHSFLSLQYYSL